MATDRIQHLHAVEVLDSRGNPTLTCHVQLEDGTVGIGTVPSGASTGSHEATELRDADPSRYAGKGVLRAVANVNTVIARELTGMAAANLRAVDHKLIALDGTLNKSNLGANAILAVSLAAADAGARSRQWQLFQHLRDAYDIKNKDYALPTPLMNVVNGGKHADSNVDLQEFWLVPIGADRFVDRLRTGAEIFHLLGTVLRERGLSANTGDEGGYAMRLEHNTDPLDLIVEAVGRSPYRLGQDVVLGLDAASTEFADPATKTYRLGLEGQTFTADQLADYYGQLIERYPVAIIEDAFAEDDWEGWTRFTASWGSKLTLVGDDLFVTNATRLRDGFAKKAANAILIKPNQIGTITETVETVQLAQRHHYGVAISHRSGETNDTAIADLAVALNADFLKAGAPNRGERVAKYNRIVEIENQLSAAV